MNDMLSIWPSCILAIIVLDLVTSSWIWVLMLWLANESISRMKDPLFMKARGLAEEIQNTVMMLLEDQRGSMQFGHQNRVA